MKIPKEIDERLQREAREEAHEAMMQGFGTMITGHPNRGNDEPHFTQASSFYQAHAQLHIQCQEA